MKEYCIYVNYHNEYFSEINDKKAQEFARKVGAKSLYRILSADKYGYSQNIYRELKF
jgi:hypothetical protein